MSIAQCSESLKKSTIVESRLISLILYKGIDFLFSRLIYEDLIKILLIFETCLETYCQDDFYKYILISDLTGRWQ